MFRSGETKENNKVTKEKSYAAKKPIKSWDANVDNIDISK